MAGFRAHARAWLLFHAWCWVMPWVSVRSPGMSLPPTSALGLQLFPGELAATCPLPMILSGWPGMACPLMGETG